MHLFLPSNIRIKITAFLFAASFLIASTAAYADCTNPTRKEGTVVYNHDFNVPQVCAGTEWIALGILNPSAGGGSCTNPTRTEGTSIYNVDYKVSQYCNGTDWIAMHGVVAGCNIFTNFDFTDVFAPPSTLTESLIIQIDTNACATDISISGEGSPQFRTCTDGSSDANCDSTIVQAWTTNGTLNDNEYLQLRLTSSPTDTTVRTATVTVGSVDDQWDVTTQDDNTPDAFNFTDQTDVALSTVILSNSLSITGITGSVSVSISGDGSPQFRINGGSWTTSGSITNGQSLELRLTSSSTGSTMRSATVTVGTGNDQWDVTTAQASKTVFTTSTTYTASAVGGIAGADAKCASRATAGGLSGTYKAWISTGAADAPVNRFTQSTDPYKLVNGTQIASNWTDLTDLVIDNGLNRDEFGNTFGSPGGAWTFTDSAGAVAPGSNNCSGWTGSAGLGSHSSTAATIMWSDTSNTSCANTERLHCFEQ